MTMSFDRLIRLLPIAFILHIAEEYLTGFPGWAGRVTGHPMPLATFLGGNLVILAILIGLVGRANRTGSSAAIFLLIAWASGNLFWNFVFHLLSMVTFGRGSPGIVTATLIYIPLSLLLWSTALREQAIRPAALGGAIAAGAAFMGAVAAFGIFHLGGV